MALAAMRGRSRPFEWRRIPRMSGSSWDFDGDSGMTVRRGSAPVVPRGARRSMRSPRPCVHLAPQRELAITPVESRAGATPQTAPPGSCERNEKAPAAFLGSQRLGRQPARCCVGRAATASPQSWLTAAFAARRASSSSPAGDGRSRVRQRNSVRGLPGRIWGPSPGGCRRALP